jgi:hypothetical protein
MRDTFITKTSGQIMPGTESMLLSPETRPACVLPGEYEYSTDSASLVWMLRSETDLPTSVIDRFEERMYIAFNAHFLVWN